MVIIDFLKTYPELYNAPSDVAEFVTVPRISYLSISGPGHTITDELIQNSMQLLVGVAFSLKCNLKFNPPDDFIDYLMPPMEILWYHTDKKKSDWKWKLLLPQPEYITEEMVNKAFEVAKKKNPEQITAKLTLQHFEEGLCIQTLHTGSYEQEKSTITFLKKEAKKNWYEMINDVHEVYLNDPRRTISKKLQTILRFPVKAIKWAKVKTASSSTPSNPVTDTKKAAPAKIKAAKPVAKTKAKAPTKSKKTTSKSKK